MLEKRYQRTLERRIFFQNAGYQVGHIWECDYIEQFENTGEIQNIKEALLPPFYSIYPREVTSELILSNIVSGRLFGAVEVDILIPKVWAEGFEQEQDPASFFLKCVLSFALLIFPLTALENICKIMCDRMIYLRTNVDY